MDPSRTQRLDEADTARPRLLDGDESSVRRYAGLVIGEFSFWKLLRYELIMLFVIPVPGALGLSLRRIFCPTLFRRVGRNPVFGRDIVLRNAHRISLGDNVVIDDLAILDGRGAGEAGIVIGDNVIVHRAAVVTSKGGSIRIGSNTDIGSHASLVSQGGVEIGESVSIAGGARIGGALVAHAAIDGSDPQGGRRYTRGAVRIGNHCTVFQNAMILDGVEIGEGSIVGAAAIVRESVPPHTTFAPHQRALSIPHSSSSTEPDDGADRATAAVARTVPGAESSETSETIVAALLEAVSELNETRARENQLEVSRETALLGGALDSLDLVNFVASAEARLERAGIHVDLAATADAEPSPLRTVGTLGDYLAASLSNRG
ncbi:MAG: hypothetical protein ACC682_04105 [Gemmatimonadota bacterium]